MPEDRRRAVHRSARGRTPATVELIVGQGLRGTGEFGRLIRLRRTQLKRRAEDIGQQIGVTASYVRSIERGERAPAPAVAADLLRALDLATSHPTPVGPEGTGTDLEFTYDDKRVVVEFKHWGAPVSGGIARAAAGATLWHLASEVIRALSQEREQPPGRGNDAAAKRHSAGAEAPDTRAAIVGAIVERLSSLESDDLAAVATFIDTLQKTPRPATSQESTQQR